MQNGIDPRVSTYLNILISVLGVCAGAGAYFTAIFGQGTGQIVVMSFGFALSIVSAINAALHAVSSNSSGPLVNK